MVNHSKKHAWSPDYLVYANGAKIGEARQGMDVRGRTYLVAVLDDPSFQQSVLCRLVIKKCGDYRLLWNR